MIKVLAMLNGELNFDHSFTESIISVEGSVQLIFIVFFFVTNIVIINVLIGIAITALKDADFLKEDLSVMSRALLVSEVEQGLNWVQVGFPLTWCRLCLIRFTGHSAWVVYIQERYGVCCQEQMGRFLPSPPFLLPLLILQEKTGRGPPSSSLPLEAVAVRETQALGKKVFYSSTI